MKKIIILLAVFTLLVAGIAFAGVSGSKHDLSSGGAGSYIGTSDQICIYCHTPHMAQVTGGAPLWNKAQGRSATGSYTSPTFDNSTKATGLEARAATITPLCMSCHDGQKAAAEHYEGGQLKDAGLVKLGGLGARWFTGTGDIDLAKNHPVDFEFLSSNDDMIISTVIGDGKEFPLFGAGKNIFSCTTCHDVHNTNALDTMLRGSDIAGSLFCLDCHNK